MPLYDFINESSGEIREVFFHMNDAKEYNGEDGSEVGQWRRVFHAPLAAIDTKLDPNNKNEFIRRTEKYKTIGETMDASAELSEKRASKEGFDPLKRKYFDQYAKERNGKKHPKDRPTKIESKYATIDLAAKT